MIETSWQALFELAQSKTIFLKREGGETFCLNMSLFEQMSGHTRFERLIFEHQAKEAFDAFVADLFNIPTIAAFTDECELKFDTFGFAMRLDRFWLGADWKSAQSIAFFENHDTDRLLSALKCVSHLRPTHRWQVEEIDNIPGHTASEAACFYLRLGQATSLVDDIVWHEDMTITAPAQTDTPDLSDLYTLMDQS